MMNRKLDCLLQINALTLYDSPNLLKNLFSEANTTSFSAPAPRFFDWTINCGNVK